MRRSEDVLCPLCQQGYYKSWDFLEGCFSYNFLSLICQNTIFFKGFIYLFALNLKRSSHWRCFVKKDVLKHFAYFIEKHLCWSLFLIKLQTWVYLFSLSCLPLYQKWSFPLRISLINLNKLQFPAYSKPSQKSRMEYFCKNSEWLQLLTISTKKSHLRCLIGL